GPAGDADCHLRVRCGSRFRAGIHGAVRHAVERRVAADPGPAGERAGSDPVADSVRPGLFERVLALPTIYNRINRRGRRENCERGESLFEANGPSYTKQSRDPIPNTLPLPNSSFVHRSYSLIFL